MLESELAEPTSKKSGYAKSGDTKSGYAKTGEVN